MTDMRIVEPSFTNGDEHTVGGTFGGDDKGGGVVIFGIPVLVSFLDYGGHGEWCLEEKVIEITVNILVHLWYVLV